MAVTESFLPIGKPTAKVLDTTQVTQTDGTVAEREAVVITDPETLANRQKVSSDGLSYVAPAGVASSGNTTTTPLGSAETYTGTGEQNDYPDVMVSCQTDNSGTLYFDFSVDGTNWTTFPVNGFAVASGVHEFHNAVKGPRYFRVRLVNDSGAQSYLRLYTYYGLFRQGNSPLNQTVGLDADAAHVRPTHFPDEVRIGRRTGVTAWNKFGYNSDVDTGTEVIWANGATFTPLTSAETFNIAYDGTGGGSTDGAGTNGALALTIYYIDSSGLPATATHTLGTDGTDTTSFSGLGINRVAVSSTGSGDVNASDITITATTAGTQQAIIPAGTGVTQQCIFFAGSNHTVVAHWLWLNVNKIAAGGSPRVTIKGWVYNRGVDSKFEVFRHTIDTGVENTVTIHDPTGFVLNATDVLWFEATTNTDNTVVNMRFSLREYQNT